MAVLEAVEAVQVLESRDLVELRHERRFAGRRQVEEEGPVRIESVGEEQPVARRDRLGVMGIVARRAYRGRPQHGSVRWALRVGVHHGQKVRVTFSRVGVSRPEVQVGAGCRRCVGDVERGYVVRCAARHESEREAGQDEKPNVEWDPHSLPL